MAKEPPRWAMRLLQSVCPAELWEGIEGDLTEQFETDTHSVGLRKAKIKLIINSLRFLRPGILLRNRFSFNRFSNMMIFNYFKVATRVMMRNKAFTAINIFGLTLGITSAILLFLWVAREFTFDQFHTGKDRIYKAWNRATDNGNISCWDVTPRILAPTLKEQFSPIESGASFAAWGDQLLFTVGEKRLLKSTGAYTDPDFLTMFSFPLLKGDARTAMNEPASIILTESFAQELFGTVDPFGETLNIGSSGNTFPLKITGILKNLPTNTAFNFDYLIPWKFVEDLQGGRDTNWGNNSVSSYVKIREGADIESVNDQIKDVARKGRAESKNIDIFLYPLTKMRLYSKFENGVPAGGRIEIIRMVAILGICLVAIACINFINLSTARAQRRAKEVAVRKVIGAFKYSLIGQFLSESVLTAICAGVISVGAAYLLLPDFSNLVKQPLEMNMANPFLWMIGTVFIFFIGLLAGAYPAFYLSSFGAVKILKGAKISGMNKSLLRNALVVLQFGFAVVLIISATVIHRQINFVQQRDAGYAKDNLVYQYMTGDLSKNYTSYKNELIQSGLAEAVTKTSSPITERWSNTTSIGWKDKDPQLNILFERFYIDDNISSTAKLTIAEGRDMDLNRYSTDSTAVIINESAAKAMGFKQPIGEIITDNGQDWHVVGVMKDFILTSPFQKVEPLLMFGCKGSWAFNVIHIRLNSSGAGGPQENIARLSALSKKYNPDYPFEYYFVDAEYDRKFASLKATQLITNIFSAVAILIAGLGLLGLSTYMIEVREKEIGIRKVMGGSVWSITRLLSFTSLKPILIAIALFSPLGWWAMNWWLSSYAYRISIGAVTLFLAGAGVILVALCITTIQTIRAAQANPVNTLRSE
jgi:putative ABC transport system permease protein